jgi:hypothetical protein
MKDAGGKALTMIVTLMITASPVFAKDNGKEKGKPPEKDSISVSAHVQVDVFADSHRNLIRYHYVNFSNRGSLPPGLAKRGGDLPPGLEKQLRRNGHLPPGLEKKLYPFPLEMERQLPPLKPGLMRGVIGGSAVILDKNKSLILDVFAVL